MFGLIICFLIFQVFSWYGTYRRRITFNITNKLSQVLDNTHVSLTIELSKVPIYKSNVTCKDVAFTDSQDQLLEFWLETGCGNFTSTTYWLKIPQLTSLGSKDLYMYYDGVSETYAGLSWSGTNQFAYLSKTNCINNNMTIRSGLDGILLMGASDEDLTPTGSSTHSHATTNEEYDTINCTNNFTLGKDSSANDLAYLNHVHIVKIKRDLDPVSQLPYSRKYAICSKPSDEVGLIPESVVMFFLHLDSIPNWMEESSTITNEDFLLGSSELNPNTAVGASKHFHAFDMTAATVSDPPNPPNSLRVKKLGSSGTSQAKRAHKHYILDQVCDSDESHNMAPYHYLHFRSTTSATHFPSKVITPHTCDGTCALPPLGWSRYAPLDGYIPRSSKNAVKLGTSGGGFSHRHNFTCMTGLGETGDIEDDAPSSVIAHLIGHQHYYTGTVPASTVDLEYVEVRYIQRNQDNHTENYIDYESAQWYCHGIFNTESTVCSNGSGICTFTDHCDCLKNHSGIRCEYTTCYGQPSNVSSSNLCSGHGSCPKYDSCSCDEDDGYYGKICDEYFNSTEKVYLHVNSSVVYIPFHVKTDITILYNRRRSIVDSKRRSIIVDNQTLSCGTRIANWKEYLGSTNYPPSECWWEIDPNNPTVTKEIAYRVNFNSKIYNSSSGTYPFIIKLLTKKQNVTVNLVVSGLQVPHRDIPDNNDDDDGGGGSTTIGIIGGAAAGLALLTLGVIIGGGTCGLILLCCLGLIVLLLLLAVVVCGALIVGILLLIFGGGAAAGTAGGAVVAVKGADELMKEEVDIVKQQYLDKRKRKKEGLDDEDGIALDGEEDESSDEFEKIGKRSDEEDEDLDLKNEDDDDSSSENEVIGGPDIELDDVEVIDGGKKKNEKKKKKKKKLIDVNKKIEKMKEKEEKKLSLTLPSMRDEKESEIEKKLKKKEKKLIRKNEKIEGKDLVLDGVKKKKKEIKKKKKKKEKKKEKKKKKKKKKESSSSSGSDEEMDL